MGLLDRGMSFLNARLKTAGAVSVTYTRGAASVTVEAVIGDPRSEAQQTTPPARVNWTEREFLILAADLAAAGIGGEPAAGDRITDATGTYKMLPRGTPQEPAWRYTDASRTCYRIHAKPV